MKKIKEQVKSADGRPIQQIYENEVLLIKEQGLDLVEEIPKFSSVKTAFFDARNRSQNVSKLVFKNKSEVEIPNTFKDFLLFDYEDSNNRIIAFATHEARDRMSKLAMFFGDGTFKCCIRPFMQLYVIHGDMGSTDVGCRMNNTYNL